MYTYMHVGIFGGAASIKLTQDISALCTGFVKCTAVLTVVKHILAESEKHANRNTRLDICSLNSDFTQILTNPGHSKA